MSINMREFVQRYGVYLTGGVVILVCIVLIFSSRGTSTTESTRDEESSIVLEEELQRHVTDNDEAVRGYLNAAQTLAEVYRFQNGGSYGGLCEGSDRLYTLEGESGGILKYIKTVGATEVFCTTSDQAYLIEAQMPENGSFYCIDNLNDPVEQALTREGSMTCR